MTTFLRVDLTASFLAMLAGIIHLGAFWGLWWTPPHSGPELYWRVGISIALIIIAVILIAIVTSLLNRDAPESDEFEDQANYRTMRNSMFVYAGGIAIIFMEAFEDMANPMVLAHTVIGIFVLSEIVRLSSLTYYLKKGV